MKDIMALSNGNNFGKKRNVFVEEDLSKANNKNYINNNYEKDSDNKEINNESEDLFNMSNNNNLLLYYYSTVKTFRNSKEYKYFLSLIQNSKNYIPKIQFHFCYRNIYKDKNYNQEYLLLDFTLDKGYKINAYNNVHIKSKEGKERNVFNRYFENVNLKYSNNIIIINDLNCQNLIPSYYNNKKKEKDILCKYPNDSISEDKESCSTSEISEKKKEKHDSDKSEKENNNKHISEKVEYLVEMFGRKGWICNLCNNFNYEKRNKCNRCGIIKRPKKLVDLNSNIANNKFNEKTHIKKGDWTCKNCGNLNYSFRIICNRCKIPKNPFLYDSYFVENNKMNNF